MEQLKVQMGAELEDPKKLQAVQQQVSIAVDNVMIEFSNYTVEQKLEEISKRLAFIRSIRRYCSRIRESAGRSTKRDT